MSRIFGWFYFWLVLVGCSTTPIPTQTETPEGQPLTYVNRKFLESFPGAIQASKKAVLASVRLRGQAVENIQLEWTLAGEYTDPNTGITTASIPYRQIGTDQTSRVLTVRFTSHRMIASRSGVLKSAFFDASPTFYHFESVADTMSIDAIDINGGRLYKTAMTGIGTDYFESTVTIGNNENSFEAGVSCRVPNSLRMALRVANQNLAIKAGQNALATVAAGYACVPPAVIWAGPCALALAAKVFSTWELITASDSVVAAQQAIDEWKQANCS
ncbi:MAG: hypothetical protein ACK41E_10705 [Deinococcales bacterium]